MMTPPPTPSPSFNFHRAKEEDYLRHPNPAYAGNCLIEVLPQYVDMNMLADDIEWRPQFSTAQRGESAVHRAQMVM
ncbi:hypothetical protein ACQUZK_09075, partial [Streptococcus pyogenes]|uniref:hypothetical protein n=1 Tax=Streptococcus pyogenes TaxID=1314 RepID=UPI003DA18476